MIFFCNKVELNVSGDGAQIYSDPPMSQQRFGETITGHGVAA